MSKRLPKLEPNFAFGKRIADTLLRPIRNLSLTQKFWAGFVILSVLTTILINNPFWNLGTQTFYEGEILRQTIVSPADISAVNEKETETIKDAAREAIRPIFTFESNRADQAVQSFRINWEGFQRKGEGANSNLKLSNSNAAQKNESAPKHGEKTELGKLYDSRRFSGNEIEAVTRALREAADGSIYSDSDRVHLQNEITLIDRLRPNQQSVASLPESSMTSLSDARAKLKERLTEIRSFSSEEADNFYNSLESLVQPSVLFDAAATAAARDAAAQSIPPVSISLKRGQTVAREGDTITPVILSQINAIQSYTKSTRLLNRFFGLLFIVSALFWIAWKFIEHRSAITRLTMSPEQTFALFGFVIFLQILVVGIFFRLAEFTAAQNVRAPFNDAIIWSFAAPFAFPGLLLTLLADRRIALFSGIFSALLTGLVAPKGLEFVLYAAISASVAVYGIGQYRNRQSVTIAGLLVGLTGAATAIAVVGFLQMPFILNTILLAVGWGLLGGIITASVTAVFLPICESLFGILTDVKLLELSNADLPVLGRLALRAPGTNQHSHAVGHLAEEACRVIGANGLMTRIGALYHDIGKLAAPEYFVENQTGVNPHDKLKPVQSAKIIISHVTYGVKLAKEMGLPPRFIDFILQHHGTRTLHYFYRKAQAEAGENFEIEESEFRYPGPKPQSKEAAIMMIADSCEAGARSLAQPNPTNIRFIVNKIIDAIISDNQLDECEITLRELTLIRESMIKSLISIYHARIDYPGYTPPDSIEKILIPAEDLQENGMKFEDPKDIPISVGGEVEDEAVDLSQAPADKVNADKVKAMGKR